MTALTQTKCMSCGAAIRWLEMSTGRKMPVNEKPERLIVLNAEGKGEVRECFVSHFVTCPHSSQWRQRP